MDELEKDKIRAIYKKFEPYIPDMELIGIGKSRLVTQSELVKRSDYLTMDIYQFMSVWFDNWVETSYKPWKKIRNENPESIWNRYKDMGYGEDFQEIRVLNSLARHAVDNFNDKKNYFLKSNIPKRSKNNELGTETTETAGGTVGEGKSSS